MIWATAGVRERGLSGPQSKASAWATGQREPGCPHDRPD